MYDGVKIVRRPGSTDLLALNADGFHSSDVGIGLTLIDSEISFTGDDFLNIHNSMNIVCDADGAEDDAADDRPHRWHDARAVAPRRYSRLLPPQLPRQARRRHRRVERARERRTDARPLRRCMGRNEGPSIQRQYHHPPVAPGALPRDLLGAAPRRRRHAAVQPRQLRAAVRRRRGRLANHFHDGFSRMGLLKAINLTYTHNLVEVLPAHGLHVYSSRSGSRATSASAT